MGGEKCIISRKNWSTLNTEAQLCGEKEITWNDRIIDRPKQKQIDSSSTEQSKAIGWKFGTTIFCGVKSAGRVRHIEINMQYAWKF